MLSSITKEIPPRLKDYPSSSKILPPVKTKIQFLPFDQLTWENFEKLCYRLIYLETDIEFCHDYGVKGDEQQGIDIFARKKDQNHIVLQCKKQKGFGPQKIKQAINKFIEDNSSISKDNKDKQYPAPNWLELADTFILCIQEELTKQRTDALIKGNQDLSNYKISLIPWGQKELSRKLKEHPDLVNDFFGIEWVKIFCKEKDYHQCLNQLDIKQIEALRERLIQFYEYYFDQYDLGITSQIIDKSTTKIDKRYIIPDVIIEQEIVFETIPKESKNQIQAFNSEEDWIQDEYLSSGKIKNDEKKKRYFSKQTTHKNQKRIPILDWFDTSQNLILLGEPGSGKSSFLRFICLELLRSNQSLSRRSAKVKEYLPIWLPFAYCSKCIQAAAGNAVNIEDMLKEFLHDLSQDNLFPLIQKALNDRRLLLLIDGLDEWTNIAEANLAISKLLNFVNSKQVLFFATSRPEGYKHLSFLKTECKTSQLAGFSINQQKDLARIWFLNNAQKQQNKSALSELHWISL